MLDCPPFTLSSNGTAANRQEREHFLPPPAGLTVDGLGRPSTRTITIVKGVSSGSVVPAPAGSALGRVHTRLSPHPSGPACAEDPHGPRGPGDSRRGRLGR